MITREQLSTVTGSAVMDSAGSRCGTCTDIYVDDRTDTPMWAVVAMDDHATRCAPLKDASMDDHGLRLACTAEQLAAAPSVATGDQIDSSLESALLRHYGMADTGVHMQSDLPTGTEGSLATGWEAEGDYATGMRDETPGEMPGARPAGSPTEDQAKLQIDLGSNRPLTRDKIEGSEEPPGPNAGPGRHAAGSGQPHLRSWRSSNS